MLNVTQSVFKPTYLTEERLALFLLIGQALCFGFALFASFTASNTLFLVDYGAASLPYVYLATALVVPCISYGSAELQKRWSLARVTLATALGFAAFYFVTWLGVAFSTTRWLSFALMVIHLLFLLLGGVLLGAQAGQIFHVRQMKRLFPLIMAGQIFSVVLGGLIAAPLLRLIGQTDNLLLLVGVSLLCFAGLIALTVRRFPAALAKSMRQPHKGAHKSLLQLLKKRYVALIFVYQMLSAMGSQLVRYLFVNQAATQFETPVGLAQFFGNFLAVVMLVTFLFLLFAASRLLTRYGLSFGLSTDPGAVAVIGLLAAVVGVFYGSSELLFFWLIVGVQFADYVLDFGLTNASVKTAFQALPADERVAVQTAIDGVSVPIAFGLTGISLLVFSAISGLTLVHIVFFTLVVTLVWGLAGVWVYREYGVALVQTLSRRALGEVELSLDDSASLLAVEKFLRNGNSGEVRLALDMLEQAEHPSLSAHLMRLVEQERAEVQVEALLRIERLHLTAALPGVKSMVQSALDPRVKSAALRALCALQEAEAVEQVVGFLDDSAAEVRLGATVGLLRYGGIDGMLAAGGRVTTWAQSPEPSQRLFSAQVLEAVQARSFYRPLLPLLADENLAVRRAALLAAGQVRHPRLLPLVVNSLGEAATRSAALAALSTSSDLVLPLVEQLLADPSGKDRQTVCRLVNLCGQLRSESSATLLSQYLTHADREIQAHILAALARCRYRVAPKGRPQVQQEIEQVLRAQATHGLRILLTKQELGQEQNEETALAFLHAALDQELIQVRQRLFLLLSFLYAPDAILRAEKQLAQASPSTRALVLETLEVTVASGHKALFLPLVDENKPLLQRIQQLGSLLPVTRLSRTERLQEIITDRALWSDDWTCACALYAIGKLNVYLLEEAVEQALLDPAPWVREMAAWAMPKLSPRKLRHAVHLQNPAIKPDP
jgi:HEAT repeat protein